MIFIPCHYFVSKISQIKYPQDSTKNIQVKVAQDLQKRNKIKIYRWCYSQQFR